MKLGKILGAVGKTALSVLVPGSGQIIEAVNEFLPDDKKLDFGTATGEDVTRAINTQLSSADQVTILSREFDVEIVKEQEWTRRFEALNRADETGKSTRPQIAMMVAITVCVPVNALAIAIFIASLLNKTQMIESLNSSSKLILSLIVPLLYLLYAYFGMRRDEKKARYNLATDQASPLGAIGSVIGAFKK